MRVLADCNAAAIRLYCCAMLQRLLLLLVGNLSLWSAGAAIAHGGVVEEDDVCVIKISYLKAHFKIYQPLLDGHDDYCEDLPNATESIFVMEYLHDELRTVPIDFRIIRNVTGKGRFARWENVAAIDDIDGATVFYQPPVIEPDVFTVIHDFVETGDYIGVVTASPQADHRRHIAVFPFEVGFTGFGYWPWIVGLVLLIQLQFLFMSGRVARWRARRSIRKPKLRIVQDGNEQT